MRGGVLLSPWTSQPPVPTGIRQDTALGASLRAAFMPAVSPNNLITGAAVTGSRGAAVVGPLGSGKYYTGALTLSDSVIAGAAAYPFVLVWAGRLTALVSTPLPVGVYIKGGSGNAHFIVGGSSTQVGYTTRNNFSVTDNCVVNVPGGTAINVDMLVVAQSLSATDHRIYCNGAMATSSTNTGTPISAFDRVFLCNTGGSNDHQTYFAGFGRQALPDGYALKVTSRPAQFWSELFQPRQRRVWFAPPVTIFAPGSDITTTDWYASAGSDLYACIDEVTANTSDFIFGQDLSTPVTMGWDNPIPAGTWDVSINSEFIGSSGQVRMVLLDAGGSTVGTTAWQVLTGAYAMYVLSVTTSATSTKFRFEVQA